MPTASWVGHLNVRKISTASRIRVATARVARMLRDGVNPFTTMDPDSSRELQQCG